MLMMECRWNEKDLNSEGSITLGQSSMSYTKVMGKGGEE